MNATITRSLDLRGVPDGTHLATAAIAMLELRPGELLEVVTDDPHAPRDFSVWCRATGHQLVAHDQREGVHHLVIQRQLAGPPPVFTEAELDGLPGPVRRYLRAAIAPGTPLATASRLRMRGHIKVGRWLPFHAPADSQPPPRLPVERPRRRRHHRLRPLRQRAGADALEAARPAPAGPRRRARSHPQRRRAGRGGGRLGADRAAAALRGRLVRGRPGHITARYRIDTVKVEIHYALDASGHLTSMVFDRWGDTEGTGPGACTRSG